MLPIQSSMIIIRLKCEDRSDSILVQDEVEVTVEVYGAVLDNNKGAVDSMKLSEEAVHGAKEEEDEVARTILWLVA